MPIVEFWPSRFRSSRPWGFTGTRVARLPVGGKSLRGKSLRLVWACCRVCSAPGRARGYQTSKTTTPMHVARSVGRKGRMMMLMREGAREAAMMIGVDGRRRRHSSAALSTYPRRARDVGGARTRGRGRHRPPGGHRVALRLEKERERWTSTKNGVKTRSGHRDKMRPHGPRWAHERSTARRAREVGGVG